MVQKNQSKEFTKVLPRSGEEIDIELEVSGSNGEAITVQISRPNAEISDQTRSEYQDHKWGSNRFWYKVMEDALTDTDYEVRAIIYKSRSRNRYFRGGAIEFDYYQEARINDVVETVLQRLDEEVVLETRKRATENEQTEAAQEQVCEDLTSELEDIFTEDNEDETEDSN